MRINEKKKKKRSNGFGSQLELYGKPIKTRERDREWRLETTYTSKKAIVSIIFFLSLLVSVNLPLSLRGSR